MCIRFLNLKPRLNSGIEFLTKNFTYQELIYSEIASRYGIVNIPNSVQKNNLKNLCVSIMQPIRNYYKKPVVVLSGYRCPELNKFINGYRHSQHLYGEAADFIIPGFTAEEVWKWIILKSGFKYDQIILEFNSWIHISFSPKHRRKNTVARRLDGKTYYYNYSKSKIATHNYGRLC